MFTFPECMSELRNDVKIVVCLHEALVTVRLRRQLNSHTRGDSVIAFQMGYARSECANKSLAEHLFKGRPSLHTDY